MSSHTDTTRKRIQELFSAWRCSARPAHTTASGDPLREIQEDVVLTSPKVYESGIITRLDLRLVDLYGDCTIAHDAPPADVQHELIH